MMSAMTWLVTSVMVLIAAAVGMFLERTDSIGWFLFLSVWALAAVCWVFGFVRWLHAHNALRKSG
jgi:lipopolysaccharide export LptBFGC system permease protein LptF